MINFISPILDGARDLLRGNKSNDGILVTVPQTITPVIDVAQSGEPVVLSSISEVTSATTFWPDFSEYITGSINQLHFNPDDLYLIHVLELQGWIQDDDFYCGPLYLRDPNLTTIMCPITPDPPVPTQPIYFGGQGLPWIPNKTKFFFQTYSFVSPSTVKISMVASRIRLS